MIAPHAPRYDLDVAVSGEAFLTPPGAFTQVLTACVRESDARVFSGCCPTAEFGLVGASMHRIDEHVSLADLAALTEIYARVLRAVLA